MTQRTQGDPEDSRGPRGLEVTQRTRGDPEDSRGPRGPKGSQRTQGDPGRPRGPQRDPTEDPRVWMWMQPGGLSFDTWDGQYLCADIQCTQCTTFSYPGMVDGLQ